MISVIVHNCACKDKRLIEMTCGQRTSPTYCGIIKNFMGMASYTSNVTCIRTFAAGIVTTGSVLTVDSLCLELVWTRRMRSHSM